MPVNFRFALAQRSRHVVSSAWVTILIVGTCLGCQRAGEPVPSLTQDQWRRVQEHILTEAPEVAFPVNAVFDDTFKLIGWDIEPESVTAGESFTVTFYWEVLREATKNWDIFVHLDAGTRQNLDHIAVGGIFPTLRWEQGQILEDVVTAELSSAFSAGDVEVFVGFYRGDDRMPITDAGTGEVRSDGRLWIGTFSSQWDPPTYEIRRATGIMRIDGILDDPAWRRARQTDAWVTPNGGLPTDLETWAKVLWDDEFLYIGMYAEDPDIWSTLTTRDADLWDEEVLEVYLDPYGDGTNYIELQINPLGTIFDARFPAAQGRDLASARRYDISGLEAAVHVDGTLDDRTDTDRSWSAEIKIPLSSLEGLNSIPPENGDQLRLNFYRYDRSGDAPTQYFAWSPVGGNTFHQPDRFGIATFTGRPVRRTPPALAPDDDEAAVDEPQDEGEAPE